MSPESGIFRRGRGLWGLALLRASLVLFLATGCSADFTPAPIDGGPDGGGADGAKLPTGPGASTPCDEAAAIARDCVPGATTEPNTEPRPACTGAARKTAECIVENKDVFCKLANGEDKDPANNAYFTCTQK